MENNTQISDQYDDEIDLRELFYVLLEGKRIIVSLTAFVFIIGVIYIMLQPLVNSVVDFILGTNAQPDNLGYVQVLLFMLLIQVGFFEILKRNR